jgi:hypothetical protein
MLRFKKRSLGRFLNSESLIPKGYSPADSEASTLLIPHYALSFKHEVHRSFIIHYACSPRQCCSEYWPPGGPNITLEAYNARKMFKHNNTRRQFMDDVLTHPADQILTTDSMQNST